MKEVVKKWPKLCDQINIEGHTPLTLWITSLNEEIIDILAANTNMDHWKNTYNVSEIKKEIPEKRQRFEPESEYFCRYNVGISPVEVAVRCQSVDWIEKMLVTWNLTGNIYCFGSKRHILNYAIENCSLNIVQLLLDKGKLTRFIILDSVYCLDKAFLDAFKSHRNIVKYLRIDDAKALTEYMETNKNRDEYKYLSSLFYQIMKQDKRIEEKSSNKYEELRIRFKILVNALELYLTSIKNLGVKDMLDNDEALKLLADQQSDLIEVLAEFPELSNQILTIM